MQVHALSRYSFVKTKADGTVESIWHVEPSGDWGADMNQGIAFAREALATMAPNLLGNIAKAMPGRFSGIEHGFFHHIALEAMGAA